MRKPISFGMYEGVWNRSRATLLFGLVFWSGGLFSQTMYKCTQPDGSGLSFRPACPTGQVATKVTQKPAPVIKPEEDPLAVAFKKRELDKYIRLEELVKNRELAIGMSEDQAIRAWGRPTKVNTTVTASGQSEQWVYERGNSRSEYVYLRDGTVSSIQGIR